MAGPGHFEPLFKMNQLESANLSTLPLPVKFHPVIFDSESFNENKSQLDDKNDASLPDLEQTNKLLASTVYFKDPFCLPDLDLTKGGQEEMGVKLPSPGKLGRNMRATQNCFALQHPKGDKNILSERKRLLEQQKEQQRIYNQEMICQLSAESLINDLLQNGFEISPPDITPRPQNSTPEFLTKISLTAFSDCEEQIGPVGKRNLIIAMHRALKKLEVKDGTHS